MYDIEICPAGIEPAANRLPPVKKANPRNAMFGQDMNKDVSVYNFAQKKSPENRAFLVFEITFSFDTPLLRN